MGNEPTTEPDNNPTPLYVNSNRSSPGRDRHPSSQAEIIIAESKFKQWKTDIEKLIKRLHTGDRQRDYLKINCLLLPIKINYQKGSSICGEDDGKAKVRYEQVFYSLQQTMERHLSTNMPFTVCQLWNLLFTLVQAVALLKGCPAGLFEFKYENIYVDSLLKVIKIATPWSFLGHAENSHKMPPLNAGKTRMVDEEVVNGSKYEAYVVGIALAEFMLLEKIDSGGEGKGNVGTTNHDELIERILKLSYYPLKLRILIVGMIQLSFGRRFSSQNVHDLLSPYKASINSFKEFHLSKTAFLAKFGWELQQLGSVMHKIRRESSQELFKSNLGSFSYSPTKGYSLYESKQQKEMMMGYSQLSGSSQSFNISATNPPVTYFQPEDFESFNLSKQIRSPRSPERELVKWSLMHPYIPENPVDWKVEQRKMQSECQGHVEDIKDQFQQFAPSHKQEEMDLDKKQKSFSSLNCSYKSAGRQKGDGQTEEIANDIIAENVWTPPPIESSDPKIVQSSVSKEQVCKTQQSHLSKQIPNSDQIAIEHDSPIEKRSEVVKEVVEYMSQIYEADNFHLNIDQNLSITSKDKENILEFKNEEFKGESDEESNKNDTKLLQQLQPAESRDSVHSTKFHHQHSIINDLDQLLVSKIEMEGEQKSLAPQAEPVKDKQSTLSQSARKKLDYLNMFKKFSPQVIAQLNLATAYPDSEKLKRSMREKISTHEIVMSKTRKLFPAAEPGQPWE